MDIKPIFTDGLDPYANLNFVERRSVIREIDGTTVFEATVLAPESWGQFSIDILAQKYIRRAGVPDKTVVIEEDGVPSWLQASKPAPGATFGAETDARMVFERMAGCWTYWAWKAGHFTSQKQARVFQCEILWMLANQVAAPNSPQWFNTGLHWAYGITRPPQGHWFVPDDGGAPQKSKDAYSRPQPHACFIQSIEDDLVNPGGIMDLWVREARIFKYGSGTGSNFSSIRGEGEPLSGGGRSSGLMSFLKIGDSAAGAIKSGGTTRRAAKMVVVDCDHPDVESFVDWKRREEDKVAMLFAGSRVLRRAIERLGSASDEDLPAAIEAALDADVPEGFVQRVVDLRLSDSPPPVVDRLGLDYEGVAYSTVSGQNSNNSIRVSDDFLNRVLEGGDWTLTRRTDGEPSKVLPATALWDRIVRAAWASADPGLQFETTINDWHTCPAEGDIRGSNPCAEYLFVDDTACNLASINLVAFLLGRCAHGGGRDLIDGERYMHAVRLWTRILDTSVSMAQLPSRQIALRTHQTRTLGLGFANLGALLMRIGLPYDSEEGRHVAACLASIMGGVAYLESARMAKEIRPFPAYERNQASMLRVIRKHTDAASALRDVGTHTSLELLANEAWGAALQQGGAHGFRNAQVSLVAPTGTIAFVMGCDTTGIEPDFALVKIKRLAGGGMFRIVNESVAPALHHLGYSEDHIFEILTTVRGSGVVPVPLRDVLLQRGVSALRMAQLDELVASLPDLGIALATLEDDLLEKLGVQPGDAPLLDRLCEAVGLSGQADELNQAACGTMTLDGLIQARHLPVFDCSSPCGDSERSISWEGHVRMMAAVQPFLSGGISKTVNMPSDSTLEDVSEAYLLAWRLGVKCIALFRDGCKLSQPLSAKLKTGRDRQRAGVDLAVAWVGRRGMPNGRPGWTQKMRVGGHKVYVRSSTFEDGRLGEIFIDTPGEGTTLRAVLNQFAIAVSVALQYGVPLGHLVDLFTFCRFEPAGSVQHHPQIRSATSIIDAVFRHLGIMYDGREDLAHVALPDVEEEPRRVLPPPAPSRPQRSMGYTGDLCGNCGSSRVVRGGTCSYCQDCLSDTGCS